MEIGSSHTSSHVRIPLHSFSAQFFSAFHLYQTMTTERVILSFVLLVDSGGAACSTDLGSEQELIQKVSAGLPVQWPRTKSMTTEADKGRHHWAPTQLSEIPGTSTGTPSCLSRRGHSHERGITQNCRPHWGCCPIAPSLLEMLGAVVPDALQVEILLGAQARAVPDGEEVQHQPCSPCTVQKGRWPGASLPLQLSDLGAMKGLFCCWGIASPWKSQSRELRIQHSALWLYFPVHHTINLIIHSDTKQEWLPSFFNFPFFFPPPSFF